MSGCESQPTVGTNNPRILCFQPSWFQHFPWIHYRADLHGVLHFVCSRADSLRIVDLTMKCQPAFISASFRNWKKALESFQSHESSQTHQFAILQLDGIQCSQSTVTTQQSLQIAADQERAWTLLRIIFTTVQYLGRQGLAFRGQSNDNGNFKQLVKLRAGEISDLQQWLRWRNDLTSDSRQN